MAVRLNPDSLRDAVDPTVYREAEELVDAGRLGEITPLNGGAECVVQGGSGDPTGVWVGVVAGAFTADCDCRQPDPDPDELCAHAVALTLGALRLEFVWSSSATPPGQTEIDPRVRQLAQVAATLPVRRLAMLVAERAATDRRLEARLLTYAGRLGAPTAAELAEVGKTVDSLADEATSGRWGLADLIMAGPRIVEELEILAQRPATEGALRVVEHAAARWDELAVHLHGTWQRLGSEPEEIGDALRDVHVRLCEELLPDPDELIERIVDVVRRAESSSCLDAPEDYLAVLGPDGVAALQDG